MNHSTMCRTVFSPYGPSKAALESETVIWGQNLHGTGVTVNALPPGGATLTGMIPDAFPAIAREGLLDPGVMLPPLLWQVSSAADTISGCRVTGNQWDE
ncbi:short-chain dehydrogenase/reductase SDR, partial [mine drainage metagenome]